MEEQTQHQICRYKQMIQIRWPHKKVLAMRSKLTLPDKDDTSDIAIDQNMFGGILTYAHFNHFNCFISDDFDKHSTTDQQTIKNIDIAIVSTFRY